MIKLEVEDYCHDCPEFKVDVNTNDCWRKTDTEFQSKTDTVIRCKHYKICAAIFNHFMTKYEVSLKPVKI